MAESTLHLCVDRLSPLEPLVDLPESRLAALRRKMWPIHQRVLHVRFLGGDPRLHERIERHVATWMQYANVTFVFDNDTDSAIRIAFERGASWSYVGVDALDPSLGPNSPTMNFGWFTPATPHDELQRVVLHEFGHALGLIHEHQSPLADIPWDRQAVIEYYSGPPNFWTTEQVEHNIFERYSQESANAGVFDPASIMLYPIPPQFTNGKLSVGWNRTLSAHDREFIGLLYPFTGQ
jgi:serralysin